MKTQGLSINLATVREQWDLREAVEGCVRHRISAIDPWRDQVAKIGLDESARIIKANGMQVTGYCRGGMFTAADAAGRQAAIDWAIVPGPPISTTSSTPRPPASLNAAAPQSGVSL